VWQLVSDACPPPPPPGACPSSIPGMSTPCMTPGQMCTYDVPGDCQGVFVARCNAGSWSLLDQSPPCNPSACPTMEPAAGASCDAGASCTYTVMPPGCPAETQNATCVGGVWKIDTQGTCGP
jgi:hypothetical protein